MRDGIRLRTRRLAPRSGGVRPTLLARTPYGIGWSIPQLALPLIASFFARRGYNVVLQDTRGRYGSGGRFYPFLHESDDGLDTLDWISKQPWFDGNLATWGPSYLGYTQWAVAAQAPSYLKAQIPIVTSADFYGFFYPGGAFSLASALRWAASNGLRRGRRAPERRLPRAARERPTRRAVIAAGRIAPFFEDWVDHPDRDRYWARIDQLDARSRRIPSLQVAGTYDVFCGPQLRDFAELGPAAGLELGPWAHGSYAISPRRLGWKQAGMLQSLPGMLRFIDHHLRGEPLAGNRVRRYVQGQDRWTEEADWPPPESVCGALHLRAGGRLDPEAPATAEAPDVYTYNPLDPVPTCGGSFLGPSCGPADQRLLEGRPDVLHYETGVLSSGIELAGPVRLVLYASTDAPATDFTAKLVHLPADDARPALNLCEGAARIHQTDDSGVNEIEIDLWHASVYIPAGDRLRLEVSSSNFPRFDAHPNMAGNPSHARRSRPARQIVHHAADAPSRLELTLVPA